MSEGAEVQGRILPVYRLTSGVNRKLLMNAAKSVLDLYGGELADPLPRELVVKYGFSEYPKAMRNIHLPENPEELDCARRRLVFSELLALCLGLGMLRGKREAGRGKIIPLRNRDGFFSALGFERTGA